MEAALQLLEGCRAQRAKLVVTGVGKSSIVAADDVALLLSNSGETEEWLAILSHLRRRGTARIALVGRIHSSLASGCDVVP